MNYKAQILHVLGAVRHARVEELFNALKAQSSMVSIATVYRNLKRLEQSGDIVAFLHPDGAVRYELAGPQGHQHLVCENCGVIIEVTLGFMPELSANLKERAKFHVHPDRLSIIGRCENCT